MKHSPQLQTPSQQKVRSIYFKFLKNLREFNIDFYHKNLTAIMGPNGCGKSTILHSLACCYQPINETESINYKFSYFFLPTTHSTWQGSTFTLTHSYRVKDKQYDNVTTDYKKQADRWIPIYKRRPSRYVSFIGIKTCVPKIEDESKKSLIEYSTRPLSDSLSLKVKDSASLIMNRDYTFYNIHEATGREYIGVEYGNTRYSSLSMGAGEQRIFFILTEVLKAPKYSLILIDEIDLLLHDDALCRLLKFLIEIADNKNLQIIFTTHAQPVINFSNLINIRHICQTNEKTLCFNETKPDAIYRLTGRQERPLEIFVEDDLAKAIIKKVCGELGLSKYVSIKSYGSVENCFTLLSGMILNEDKNLDNMIFVIDGDVYRTEEQQIEAIARVLTGNTERFKNLRKKALMYIRKFLINQDLKPEKFLHNLLVVMPVQNREEYNEIINVAKDIRVVEESHKYIDDIIERLDYSREVGLKAITDVIALSEQWSNFILEIKDWLTAKKTQVNELD